MFERELSEGRLMRPFAAGIDIGGYWLTSLKSRKHTPAMAAFRSWIAEAAADQVALSSASTVSRSLV
jgi:LysR family transcriptional regulator of beta-lactamase